MVEFAGGFLKECRKEHSESLDHVISPGRSAAQFCLLVSTCYRLATFIGRQHHELLHFIYYANYKLWEISSSHVLADGQIRELRGKKSAAFWVPLCANPYSNVPGYYSEIGTSETSPGGKDWLCSFYETWGCFRFLPLKGIWNLMFITHSNCPYLCFCFPVSLLRVFIK